MRLTDEYTQPKTKLELTREILIAWDAPYLHITQLKLFWNVSSYFSSLQIRFLNQGSYFISRRL